MIGCGENFERASQSKVTTEAILNVTRTMAGEVIPVLRLWLDPRCLSYSVAVGQPTRPQLKHIDECKCGQLPITVQQMNRALDETLGDFDG